MNENNEHLRRRGNAREPNESSAAVSIRPVENSESETPKETFKHGIFIQRAPGMTLAEFEKVCVEQFERVGIIRKPA
jgi:hypothetical protein